jgi:hypothetical protein
VAAWWLESLPPHSGEDAAADGIAEAARRREEVDSGRVKPISADEFWAAVGNSGWKHWRTSMQ